MHIILLAGGTGSRFGLDTPKQFAEILGQPVLAYSLRRFSDWLDRLDPGPQGISPGALVLVSHRSFSREALQIAEGCIPTRAAGMILAEGGPTRHLSSVNGVRAVWDALGTIPPSDLCLIHDTARPYVPGEDLNRLLEPFLEIPPVSIASGGPAGPSQAGSTGFGAASLVAPSSETLVEGSDGRFIRGLDRARVHAVKTPQILSGLYADTFISGSDRPEYTDLLRWAESFSLPAALVSGSPLNIKLTTPDDRVLLEAVLRREQVSK